ncbi:D-alanyl-D-alanine carboxypeptidase family protein [Mesorhizobium sp. M0296]|uniref:D-alanyl-D-alanine carboxypeptidase family protein n=1 Tax=Mesorhizobium sp. M0296 TaxID=2956931 RepID=UPI00333DFFEE
MVKVPEYQSDISTRPIFQQDLDANATPEAFGAGIGRGMQSAARGLDMAGDAVARVQELEDVARAKDADNSYSDWLRERMYGDNGFMTLEGRNAIDQRKTFEEDAANKRKEFGSSLSAGAARAYQTASQARLQSVYQQSIIHTAGERKAWFKDASAARVQTFANDALVNFNNPSAVNKNLGAGIMEIRETGALQGWDADTLKLRESEFTSGVHKNITLRIAQDDPVAAESYMKANAKQMTGADQYALSTSLETELVAEKSKREAEAILSGGRAADVPAASAADRTVRETGPTKARGFLYGRLTGGKGKGSVDGLRESFATNLAAMMQDAPPGIREGLGIYSGYRSPEHQAELYASAVKRYGSPAAARKWVAPPGHSQHNEGNAVDLAYNGQSLSHAPKNVVDWVHENAGKYGLYFPMKHEPWHVEPMGTRGSAGFAGTVAPRSNTVAPRAVAPSYDDIETKLAAISDPDVRDATRKRLYSALEAQSKAGEAQEKQAKAELWKYIDQGQTPDQVPMEVRQAAGMAAVSSAWEYMNKAASGRAVDSDETLLYDMRKYAATNPTDFAALDLNDYRDRLSKEAIKELTGTQTTALTDQRKAREDGMTLTTAFSQAQSQLEAVGITTTGKEDSAREDAAKRVAQFQNALAAQMEEFKRSTQKSPNQMEIQSMINRLLLPVVIRDQTERSIWNPLRTPWSLNATSERSGFAFEAGQRSDSETVDVVVKYGDIPIDLRRGISTDLERELGRKPSEEEVVQRYEDFVLNR